MNFGWFFVWSISIAEAMVQRDIKWCFTGTFPPHEKKPKKKKERKETWAEKGSKKSMRPPEYVFLLWKSENKILIEEIRM